MKKRTGRIMRAYISDKWEAVMPSNIKAGDYVIATKYADGDPGDHFCVGFYESSFDVGGSLRHLITDAQGKQFRANGFRRVARIGSRRGRWIVEHLAYIEQARDRFSVWHWVRAPWAELNSIDAIKSLLGQSA